MNKSTREKFKGLLQNDKKIAFDTLVKQQDINCKIIIDAACKELAINQLQIR